MSRAGAPSQRNKQRKDVLIKAPPAILRVGGAPSVSELDRLAEAGEITPQDIISMQQAEIKALKIELNKQRVSASTLAKFGICMIHIILEHSGGDHVRIPAQLYNRMEGAEIQVSQPTELGGDVVARYIENDNAPTLPEGAIS